MSHHGGRPRGPRSHAVERLGFNVGAGNVSGQTLLTAKRDYPIAWTLHMLAWRYQAGLLVPVGTINPNPDNETEYTGATVGLTYGVDGVTERVVFDYPRQGGTVQFHAGFVDVYVNGPTTGLVARPPLLGGFLVPEAYRDNNYAAQPPTLTTRITVNAGATLQWLDVATRARAYRLVPLDANTVIGLLTVFQLGPTALLRGQDYGAAAEGFAVFDSQPQGHLYPTRQTWIPLDCDAAGLRIVNTAATAANLAVVFLLDIG